MAKAINKINRLNWAVVIGFLIVFGIAYYTMKNQNGIVSNLLTLSFPVVFIALFQAYKNHRIPRSYTPLLLGLTILVFFNISLRLGLNTGGGFDYYKKAIMFVTTLAWFTYCANTNISKSTLFYMLLINLILIALYQIFYKQTFKVVEGEVYVTLNFSNPNLTGMFILHSLLYVAISIVSVTQISDKFIWRILWLALNLVLFVGAFSILMMTGNRSSLMSLILWGILVIIDFIFKHKINFKKWMIWVLVAFPFIFVFIYATYAATIGDTITFGMDVRGKSNTSRNHVWMPILKDFFHYFFIGDYYKISNGTGFGQLHNTHLDVFASYGIFALILYIIFLFKITFKAWQHSHSLVQRTAAYAFISILVSCSFEAALVAGSVGLFILTGGFLLLCNFQPTVWKSKKAKNSVYLK